ncbi:MarR family winged helix-turn-helix transcriptional regulator [Pedobacter sp. L105]|uniref:MarR family winged helix-turn-helix transcriptional regulator n=1 Tax=Pedobacter sp. L105 TaxID=1641871 RepID=UPI00131C10E0|nr:winged helix DNA-binding protein [Pedobacter sp. L105]
MNKTLAIVQEWAGFEEQNPDGSIEDFCREYLKKKQVPEVSAEDSGRDRDYACRYALSKVINRLSRLWMFFTLNEMKPMGLTSFDEFVFLLTVERSGAIRKKDLIYMHFIEISSGILVIDRLIKKGFLNERVDDHDKRSKQVMITEIGKKVLKSSHVALDQVYKELYGDMSENKILLCLEHLKPLQDNIAKKWNGLKKFEPIAEDV